MDRRHAAPLAIVAGVLLLVAGNQGGSLLLQLGEPALEPFLPPPWAGWAHLVTTALLLVASWGGFTVLAGALAHWRGWHRLGNFLIGLGVGLGALELLLDLGLDALGLPGAPSLSSLWGPAGVGVLLCIVAARVSKRAPPAPAPAAPEPVPMRARRR